MKYLCVGDLHICISNFDFMSDVFKNIAEVVSLRRCDAVVFLGDVLDNFGITEVNFAVNSLKQLSNTVELFIIVGNHDYINNHQFLSENHWMISLKKTKNINIIDKVEAVGRAIFCPFVEEGRFIEALDTKKEWRDSLVIFAHQGFAGVPTFRGPYISNDAWNSSLPTVVSGHIHCNQFVKELGVWYPGSVQETKRNYFLVVNFSDKGVEMEQISMKGHKSGVFSGTVADIVLEEKNICNMKIVVRDSREKIQEFKESCTYKDLCSTNSFKFIPQTIPFIDLFRKKIMDAGDVYVLCAAERIINRDEIFDERDHLLIPICLINENASSNLRSEISSK